MRREPNFTSTYRGVNACLSQCLNSVLNVKALVGTFNQEKALVGAFSVIVKPISETDGSSVALSRIHCTYGAVLTSRLLEVQMTSSLLPLGGAFLSSTSRACRVHRVRVQCTGEGGCDLQGQVGVSGPDGAVVEQPLNVVHHHAGLVGPGMG